MKSLSYYILIFVIILSGCAHDDELVTTTKPQDETRKDIIEERIIGNQKIESAETREKTIDYIPIIKDEKISQQILGTIIYKVDTILFLNTTSRVESRIIKSVDDDTTEDIISITHKSSTGKIQTDIIPIGNVMGMELSSLKSNAFDISNIMDGNQMIKDDYVATWIWGVTPLKIGQYDLILKAVIKEDKINKYKIIFDKIISVENIPKKKYNYELIIPDNIKKYNDYIVKLTIYETNDDDYDFKWGGDGKISLRFNDITNIQYGNDYSFRGLKDTYDYTWIMKPIGKEKKLEYEILINSEYRQKTIIKDYIEVKYPFIERINKFIEKYGKNWYWLFTTLIIPLIIFIRKKFTINIKT